MLSLQVLFRYNLPDVCCDCTFTLKFRATEIHLLFQTYSQQEFTGKIRTSKSHRQARLQHHKHHNGVLLHGKQNFSLSL